MRLDSTTTSNPASPAHDIASTFANGLSPTTSKGAQTKTNGQSTNGSNGSASHGSAPGDDETWHGHNKKELTRILIQSLTGLGYTAAAEQLCIESGQELERPTVAAFRQAVLDGNWAQAESLLLGDAVEVDKPEAPGVRNSTNGKSSLNGKGRARRGLPLSEAGIENEMLFRIRQQKYLELIEKRETGAALSVLRQELTPLKQDPARLHALTSLMMCSSAEDLRRQAQWDGTEGTSRNDLLSILSRCVSPSVMLPEHRLATLLDQVKQGWERDCLYHNTREPISLVVDHFCRREDFPTQIKTTLEDHIGEVWFVAFSPDGSMLATAGSDFKVIIYECSSWRKLGSLVEHKAGVCYVAWSPDSRRLISCSKETDNTAIVWDVKAAKMIHKLPKLTYAVVAAEWNPRNDTFVVASQDPNYPLLLYDAQSFEKLYAWTESSESNFRLNDIAISTDGTRLVALLVSRILVFDIATRQKLGDFPMSEGKMISVNLSRNAENILVGVNDSKILLLSMETGEILQMYEGHTQSQFIIRSAFGGAQQSFVVSGSEDQRVYIWRTTGQLVDAFEAHLTGCVNAVAWHPTEPAMFATAGDDKAVRVWVSPSWRPPSLRGGV